MRGLVTADEPNTNQRHIETADCPGMYHSKLETNYIIQETMEKLERGIYSAMNTTD